MIYRADEVRYGEDGGLDEVDEPQKEAEAEIYSEAAHEEL